MQEGNGSQEIAKPAERNALFPVGVSLYPLDSEAQSPEDWYERDLAENLDLLQGLHCSRVRVFVSWQLLEPQAGQYAEEAFGRLLAVVSAIQARRMKAIVCFFADDSHSELTDVAWGRPRDPHTDSYLLERAVALVSEVVGRLRGDKGVFGWQLGNEAFLSSFSSAEDLLAWTTALRDAILEQDPTRPIALGADAETLRHSSGVDAREAISLCDYTVSHTTAAYQAYAASGPRTSGPSTYLQAFLLQLARGDSPVLLDEVGPLTLEDSHAEESAALRVSLWSGLCNGASGALLRRLRDMETDRREPYFIDPFETLVGVLDTEGVPKPAYDEARRFIDTVARIDLEKHPLVAERAAIVMPAERYEPLPSLAGLYAPRACLQAFISAKRAQIPISVVREGEVTDAYRLLIVPSAFSLGDEMWHDLAAFVQAGGTAFVSYGGGDAHPVMRSLFGVDFLGDAGPRDSLSCRVAQPGLLGDIRDFEMRFEVAAYALLSAKSATVVATDASGSPLLTVNQVGQGRAIYLAAPLERAVAQNDPWATPVPVSQLLREAYGAAARGAGCTAPIGCDVPDVEVALFQGDGDDVLVLLNHSASPVQANLTGDRHVDSIADVRGGEAVSVRGPEFGVKLEAAGVAALKLTYV